MSDYVIRLKNGREFGVDDVIMNDSGTKVKYIERFSHRIKSVRMHRVSEIRREHWGKNDSHSFSLNESSEWIRPV